MRSTTAFLLPLACLPLLTAAHGPRPVDHDGLQKRARASTTLATTTTAPAAAISSAPAATSPLPTTYAAGATPVAVAGAPPLPDLSTFKPSDYPALDVVPPIDSAEMKAWIAAIDMTKIPNIPPTGLNGCGNTTFNAQAIANAGADKNCWWTCGHCTRDTDISFCPTKDTWGVSFDDGPSPDTPRLLQTLAQHNTLATFFVVGSRAVSRPQMLQTEYMMGHQISVHTWAHSTLTTLSNEAIIAELAWSKAAIKAITGVTPNTMRPPYGDIDDRVRYISMQLGLTPIIWTVNGADSFDTQDWQIADPSAHVTPQKVLTNFNKILADSKNMDHGFIVLEHDLMPTEVDLGVQQILPEAYAANLTLQPIITCLGQKLSEAYIETASNKSSAGGKASGSLTSSVVTTTNSAGQQVTTTMVSVKSAAEKLSLRAVGPMALVGVAAVLALL